LQTESDKSAYPNHIAIIMDGNGRWAKGQGQPRNQGHQQGVDSVKSVVSFCVQNNISYLTLFAFGQDNNKRPHEEVEFIIALFAYQLKENVEDFCKRNIKIKVVGNLAGLNKEVTQAIAYAEEATKDCSGLQLAFALNYAGRWDLSTAAKNLAKQVQTGQLSVEQIDADALASALPSSCLPNVDLMIRTSGEARLSDFIIWQLAYAELYFTPIAWPEFHTEALQEACDWFASRERRFGQTSEQLK
jgi:undecaprenyl diphosphate synthase